MSEYERKRNFGKTPEPAGRVDDTINGKFVVHAHFAERAGQHHDFRLGIKGVLSSWVVPKGVPIERGVRRLAIKVEDHPASYINFEGEIPKGSYGAGKVMIWDKGTFISQETAGGMRFTLRGRKLEGDYSLIRIGGKKWLIFKRW